MQVDVVVLGSGPGGYTAAFRAADLGKKVALVETYDVLGGVCLNVGCIPSKALLHVANVLTETPEMQQMGIKYDKPKIDVNKLRSWVEKQVIGKLTTGLKGLAKQRKVNVVTGYGKFISSTELKVTNQGKTTNITFEQAIIATGSHPIKLPFIPEDPRIVDSTGALALSDIPKSMLVIGGGIIGMELGTVYDALGTDVTVVELTPSLLSGVDPDLVKPLQKRMQKRFTDILLDTKVTSVQAKQAGLSVTFTDNSGKETEKLFDKILLSVGRVPNSKNLGLESIGVELNPQGFIQVDNQQRTNLNNFFAIGDVAGNPMLAHKAIPEGKIAAEVIAGKKHYFDANNIPSVAYTDPEVAWVGISEQEAKQQGINYGKGVFPWMASGRSLSTGRDEGLTKLIFDNDTKRIIGGGIVGTHAGDLIAEVGLAIEMGCDVEDLALTIHPHPTLSETICQAAEAYDGTITDLYMPKK